MNNISHSGQALPADDEKMLIDKEGDYLLKKYDELISEYNNLRCPQCGIIQGKPLKGFRKYYCEHIDEAVEKKLAPLKKAIWERTITDYKMVGGRT